MAEKRMFSKQIIDSDAFLEMPLSTQALYFHLSMRADDDGFLNNAKKVMKIIGANQNDYDLLVAKSFVIQFPDGICVIKHWRINNYLRKDRYTETIYQEEKAHLTVQPNGRYSLRNAAESDDDLPLGIPVVYRSDTQYRIDKNREEKNSIDKYNSVSGDTTDYSYSKNSNVSNLEYVLKNDIHQDSDYVLENEDLHQCLKEWMEYKDGRKPKSSNHYGTEIGLKKTITQFVSGYREYGIEALKKVVDDSMANNYSGVIWDRLSRMPKNQQVAEQNQCTGGWKPASKLAADEWQ
ncbi:replisome organizer [Coprococcus comes]|uniref:replisome organizer n=1 Tax=Coprococcus comes TaxID=410072 RepID=UPI001FABC78C|nr:replisome organizer [Coprococcus comes]